ncbi:phospho-sugar mutase [Atopobacter sp. AH10]|uniref:phospho-sugar mutase n=1 Tax=Atopobacter sp. AH10 TaxID=2315861 RepID=UPI000EF273A4|nr:phospho-sugar mutase [Atopobacter sp. AH10]RLK62547.1 phospho-sugar mutase [Atopobacter sp. AH10]
MSWKELVKDWKLGLSGDSDLKKELDALEQDPESLADAFSHPLEFGTAGMRGLMGPGINRMNIYTVRQATYGLAQVVLKQGEGAKQAGVVISYDSRHHSREFAFHASQILVGQGIRTYMYDSLRPTPVLSFAVRYLKTAAGIMITASHNPKQYNGYKCYGPDGGQMPPEDAIKVTEAMLSRPDLLSIEGVSQEELLQSDLFQLISDEVDQAYLKEIASVTVDPSVIKRQSDLKFVYTPLHGTGQYLMEKVFREAGFKSVHYVDSQKDPDGEFSTVKSPNPEDGEAFIEAEKIGRAVHADVLIASDPDADRMGAAVRLSDGSYRTLTGNQIGAILLDYLLKAKQAKGELSDKTCAIKSIVSGELATKVAHSYGVEMRNVLTGFKYIAEQIHLFEQNRSGEFVFGFEESYGYLVKAFVRDKDALQATLLLAEVAAYQAEQGLSLADALEDLYARFGVHAEKTLAFKFEGESGQERMKEIMKQLRDKPLTQLLGASVAAREDYLTSQRVETTATKPISLPKSDVLKYYLDNGDWLAFRPSGTEPKLKVYMGVTAENQALAQEKIAGYEGVLRELLA